MVGVGYCGHGIDLEVFVRSDRGNLLDWSPVSERWLGIVEPLVAHLLNKIVINMSHSSSNLSPWDSSTLSQEVAANLLVDGLKIFIVHQIVVDSVSASNALNIV